MGYEVRTAQGVGASITTDPLCCADPFWIGTHNLIPMARSRNWVFTYHLEDGDNIETALAAIDVRYIVFGREVCPETGRRHLQGYVEFHHAKTINAAKTALGSPRFHLETRRGSQDQAIDYCKKDGDFVERGIPAADPAIGGQLEKDRWTRARDAAKRGDFEAIDDELYIRYQAAFKKIRMDAIQERTVLDGPLLNEWFVGPSGSGKSRTAREENPRCFDKDPMTRWWDGYNGEDTVLIDDFDKYQKAQGGDMKRWSDRYSFMAAVKGGYIYIRPKKIVVTSQYLPQQIWDDQETLDAITRRFTIRHFGPPPGLYAPIFNPPPALPPLEVPTQLDDPDWVDDLVDI